MIGPEISRPAHKFKENELKILKNYFWICAGISFINIASANEYIVPAIDKSEPLPLMSSEKPLNARDKTAVSRANDWINAEQYPIRKNEKVTYLFGGGQASIVCAPLKLCVLELEEGEQIVEEGVHLGDTARWMLAPSVGANNRTHLIIKPVEVGLETSLVLITDKRTYHMRLISRKNDYMPIVAFDYPEQTQQSWQSYYQNQKNNKESNTSSNSESSLSDLDFNYKISGCQKCEWKPLRIYNNGAQTIIQMNSKMSQTEAPALVVMTDQGEQMVNYRIHDDRYIVDQVFSKAVLILGVGKKQDRVTIKRQ